jgi:hypothetical protein
VPVTIGGSASSAHGVNAGTDSGVTAQSDQRGDVSASASR